MGERNHSWPMILIGIALILPPVFACALLPLEALWARCFKRH
jgi:hypothetical protein